MPSVSTLNVTMHLENNAAVSKMDDESHILLLSCVSFSKRKSIFGAYLRTTSDLALPKQDHRQRILRRSVSIFVQCPAADNKKPPLDLTLQFLIATRHYVP